jgi:hypothetical protein
VRTDPGLVVDEFQSLVKGIQGTPTARATLVESEARLRPTTAVDEKGTNLLIQAAKAAGYLDGGVRYDDLVAPSVRAPCAAG